MKITNFKEIFMDFLESKRSKIEEITDEQLIQVFNNSIDEPLFEVIANHSLESTMYQTLNRLQLVGQFL